MNLFTAEKENLNKIIKLINDQLRIIVNSKFTANDIERAKGYLIGSILFNNESSDEIATWFAYQEILGDGKILSPQKKCEIVQKISRKEIVSVARKYFREDGWYLSLIGQIKESEVVIEF